VVARGAAAHAFGVGTRMGTSEDAPSLGGVYKLVEDSAGPKIKLSAGKATLPGRKQVYRLRAADGTLQDTIALQDEPPPPGARPLLVPVMSAGRVRVTDTLARMRERCAQALRDLPPALRDLHGTPPPPVSLSPALQALQTQMFGAAARPTDSS
jgi:nicotinate phosphoribosyltransferase